MGLFGRAQCAIGLHKGNFTFDADGSCWLTRHCERCSAVSRKVEHYYGPWHFVDESDPSSCDTQRICARCGGAETGEDHDFAEPQYIARGSCEQMASCQRCRAQHYSTADHRMQWRRLGDDPDDQEPAWMTDGDEHLAPCVQVETCTRCGYRDSDNWRIHHAWGPWRYNRSRTRATRGCRRCPTAEKKDVVTSA